MGLGVALTAFLTGFSKQAKAEIETRNAELRENMDKQIEEHEKKYQLEYDLKKEQRKRLKERSAVLDVELESLIMPKNILEDHRRRHKCPYHNDRRDALINKFYNGEIEMVENLYELFRSEGFNVKIDETYEVE